MCGLAYFVDAQMIRMCAARDAHMKIRKTKRCIEGESCSKSEFFVKLGAVVEFGECRKKELYFVYNAQKRGVFARCLARREKKSAKLMAVN